MEGGIEVPIAVHQTRCMKDSDCSEGAYCHRTSNDYGLCVRSFAPAAKEHRVSNSMEGGTEVTITVHQTRCMDDSDCSEGSYCHRTSSDYGACVRSFTPAAKEHRVSNSMEGGTQVTTTVHQTRCMDDSDCSEGSYCHRTSSDYGACVRSFAPAAKEHRISYSMEGGHSVC
ncbi:hypothetical protein DFH09DRAFT_1197025 [Mycena vulgaris]|nr:hypothetical protein DFH09DRAFT_1197025 [Mycena vulgaris]